MAWRLEVLIIMLFSNECIVAHVRTFNNTVQCGKLSDNVEGLRTMYK